jgi:hypothetical protein
MNLAYDAEEQKSSRKRGISSAHASCESQSKQFKEDFIYQLATSMTNLIKEHSVIMTTVTQKKVSPNLFVQSPSLNASMAPWNCLKP